jgi:uncharacterized YigZ family protein
MRLMARYLVPAGRTRVETRAGNSRFIATLARADSLAAAREILAEIRREFPDATHHVYAFRAGHGPAVQEALSDDGEPAGTSGPPVMAVLRGADLGDAALIVTRYFGGTKLGTGGLVAAYQAAAKAVLAAAAREPRIDRSPVRLVLAYPLLAALRNLVYECDGVVTSEQFAAEVELTAEVASDRLAEFSQRVANLTSGRVRVERV